jgi:glycosyltransferase involved in cell wall biosynthesis
MIPISVITPTFRVGIDLYKFVLSIQKQLREGDELIVIDNDKSPYASKIATLERVRYYKYPENRGPCPARNYGAGLSKNEWLLFLDDDGIAPDGMLDGLRQILVENPDFYAIRGKVIPKKNRIYNYMQSHYDIGEWPIPYFLNLECIVAIRKREFDAVGGWNDSLYGHEGEELTYRLLDRFGPENCQYHPDLVFHHDFSDCLLKYLKKDERHTENYKSLVGKYNHLNPLIDEYKKLSAWKHESIKNLPLHIQKKIRFVLQLKDICKRRPKFKRFLFALLQGLQSVGIKV